MMKNEYSHSVLVYMKKKFAYSKREEQLDVLADKLGGRSVGGGTCFVSGKRDQQFLFKSLDDVKTFLDYPTVREAILSEVDVKPVEELI